MGYKKSRKPAYDWRDAYPKTPEHPLGFLVAYIPLEGDQILVYRDYGNKMYLSTKNREWPYLDSGDRYQIEENGCYIHSLCAKSNHDRESLIAFWEEWKAKEGEPIVYASVEKGFGAKPAFLFATADGVVDHPTIVSLGGGRWGEGIWRILLARAVAEFFGMPDYRAVKRARLDMIQGTTATCNDPRIIAEYAYRVKRLYRDDQIVAIIR